MPKDNVVVQAGRKVLSTDVAQDVVGSVVDKLEEVAIDKVDDAAGAMKERAAKAGRRGKKATAKRGAKKKTTAKRSPAKKSTAKRSSAKKTTAKRR